MKFCLLFLLLLGCGRKTIYTYPAMPMNEASPLMKSDIQDELDKLQKDFAELSANIDLGQIPVIVSQLPFGVVGRCQFGRRDKGEYIILSPDLFQTFEYQPIDYHLFEKEFVRVLIHEIGHCYFNRSHEEPTYLEKAGFAFEFKEETGSLILDKIPTSLMPAQTIYRMPKVLRRYYLEELVSGKKLSSPEDLTPFAPFQMNDLNKPEPAVP